jgi:hypothetical protein
MAAGRTISKDELNNSAAAIAASLHATMDNVAKMKAVLDGYSSAQLVSVFGFVQADADVLKSAFTDMDQLRVIFTGGANLASAKDFRAFTKQLLGTGLY